MLFLFEGCILLRLLLWLVLGAVNRNCTCRMFFIITITFPLHFLAPIGHLQVEYTLEYILVTS
jgi:hypothetical protein